MVSAFRHSASIGRCFGHAGDNHCLECEEARTLTEANFSACLRRALPTEDGFSNDPADHGVTSKLGFTAATLVHGRGGLVTQADVRVIQPGVRRAIYRVNYWNTVHDGELPDSVDLAVIDIVMNNGPHQGQKGLAAGSTKFYGAGHLPPREHPVTPLR
jgi:hypothetical protein